PTAVPAPLCGRPDRPHGSLAERAKTSPHRPPNWWRAPVFSSLACVLPYNSGCALMGTFYSREELIAARRQWKETGRTVVFTNGCYDLLHPGHVRLLEQARSLGDVLILALNSDDSVRRLKGPSRPLLSERERAEVAAGLAAVDAVTIFEEDTPRELIAAVLPDVLVKGADWAHWIAGREEVEAAGGQVMALALEPGYSTSGIVETILARTP